MDENIAPDVSRSSWSQTVKGPMNVVPIMRMTMSDRLQTFKKWQRRPAAWAFNVVYCRQRSDTRNVMSIEAKFTSCYAPARRLDKVIEY